MSAEYTTGPARKPQSSSARRSPSSRRRASPPATPGCFPSACSTRASGSPGPTPGPSTTPATRPLPRGQAPYPCFRQGRLGAVWTASPRDAWKAPGWAPAIGKAPPPPHPRPERFSGTPEAFPWPSGQARRPGSAPPYPGRRRRGGRVRCHRPVVEWLSAFHSVRLCRLCPTQVTRPSPPPGEQPAASAPRSRPAGPSKGSRSGRLPSGPPAGAGAPRSRTRIGRRASTRRCAP
jgi:hypothetical protein